MISKIQKALKNKKGFTLVEVIVVLVIIAILAALLIPALTGYIDKANEEAAIAECRSAVMAAQTLLSEKYAASAAGATIVFAATADANNPTILFSEVTTLAELNEANIIGVTVSTPDSSTLTGGGTVTGLVYDNGKYRVTYTKNKTDGSGKYDVTKPGETK